MRRVFPDLSEALGASEAIVCGWRGVAESGFGVPGATHRSSVVPASNFGCERRSSVLCSTQLSVAIIEGSRPVGREPLASPLMASRRFRTLARSPKYHRAIMSLGITLHFQPSASGHWRQLYIADFEAHCAECGWAEVKRYYLDTPFHSLTVRRLEHVAANASTHFAADCGQCGAPMTSEDVQRQAIHFGFADGTGLIQRFATRDASRWQLTPNRALDGQIIPQWDPEENIASVVVDALAESTIHRVFGRLLSPKEAVRSLLIAGKPSDVELSHGLRLRLDRTESPPGEAAQTTDDASAAAMTFAFPVVSDARSETDRDWSGAGYPLPGHPWEWLSDFSPPAPKSRLSATITVEIPRIREALDRIIGTFPIDTVIDENDVEILVSTQSERLTFSKAAIAREAAATCSEPGDIAHLELCRALHALNWEQAS